MIRARTPSLRTRVTLAATAATVVIVAIVGAVAWTQVHTSAYRELDARVDTLSAAMQPSISNPNATTVATGVAAGALATIRLGTLSVASTTPPVPAQSVGVRDETINGADYRVKTVSVLSSTVLGGLATVSVAIPLRDTETRIDDQRRALLFIAAGAVVAAAVLAWLLGGLAVRPLRRLARQTAAIGVDAGPESPERIALQSVRGAREAEDLAEAMDALLHRVDDERTRTQEALATARDFASVSAHELRTPLTAMRTDLEVLDTFAPDAAARAEIVGDLRRAHARIQETLAALESLAQGELGGRHRETLDVVDLLDRVVTEASARHPGVRITLAGARSVIAPVVETGLRMAVDNAVLNAIRHGEATEVVVATHPAPTGAAVVVDDNGRGIPVADRDRLFRRFERGTSKHSGSGLGLALIAQQAALHHGTATLTDSPLGGTRLTVTIGA